MMDAARPLIADCIHAVNLGNGTVHCDIGEKQGQPSAGWCINRCAKRESMPPGETPRVQMVQITAPVTAKGGKPPGTLVRLILARMGINGGHDCGCAAMEKRMNELGYLRCCTTNLPELVSWFGAKAKAQGIDVGPVLLLAALKAAWDEVRGGE